MTARRSRRPEPTPGCVSCDVLAEHLLLTLRRGGAPLLAITDHGGRRRARDPRRRWPPARSPCEHASDYRAGSVIIAEESLIEPPRWSELDLATGGRRELSSGRRYRGFDAARCIAPSGSSARQADGTSVPVTLAYRADTPLDGTAPCLLYGYGAYEACLDAGVRP